MNNIKRIKSVISEQIKWTWLFQYRRSKKYFDDHNSRFNSLKDDEKTRKRRFVYNKKEKCDQLCKMLEDIDIDVVPNKRFQSWIDTGLYVGRFNTMVDNIPPYYNIILDNSLESLKMQYVGKSNSFNDSQYRLICAIETYIYRIIDEISRCIEKNPCDGYLPETRRWFERMLTHEACSVEEVLQRILFWSSLFWQSQHTLVGIGRLDKMLAERKYECDDTYSVLLDFYNEIHRYYAFKSGPTSMGDTGQIIIIGGLDRNGQYFYNDFTYDIINVLKKSKLPDPKILLRCSSKMP